MRVSATVFSLGEKPSRTTLVESQTMARIPSSPSAVNASGEVTEPATGVGSIFQSPVWSTRPAAVRIAMAFDSGIECETGTYSSSNGPTVTRRPGLTSRSSTFGAPGSERRRVSSRFLAKRVA